MTKVRRDRSNPAGFTILEMVFAFGILVLLLAMTSVAMRPTIDQEGPRGLAYTLAGDLRAARAEAVRSGRPVAFCFPSDRGTNSLSRSAHIREGDQRGTILRSVSYESEYDATIFLGTWGSATRKTFDIPSGWKASTVREMAVFFGPDGRAYSEDVPELDGRYPILVASGLDGRFNGATGTVSAARNPQTVWVNRCGAVEVETNKVPVGTVPEGGTDDLSVAELSPDAATASNAPTVFQASFLPQQIEDIETSGIGQNYIQIHPNQRDGQQLEYGLATIEVLAEDQDGGPLTYTMTAEASAGDGGKFSIARQQGEMSYVYDKDAHRRVWKAVVSWRPPPAAPVDLTYEISMLISDPEGNTVEASTGASLLPGVTNLPPARLAVETTGGDIYLTNLDGANEIRLTRDGAEYDPFFSRDGSSIFTFHDLSDGSHRLRGRPANGSTRYVNLGRFRGSTSQVHFDPTLTYAAILTPGGTVNFDWGKVTVTSSGGGGGGGSGTGGGGGGTTVTYSEGVDNVDVTQISIINLMSDDPPISVTGRGDGTFYWAANARHTFHYGEEEPTDLITEHGYGPFHEWPGHETHSQTSSLVGFPPHPVGAGITPVSAEGRIYNPADEDWYLEIEAGKLVVHNQATSTSAVVASASSFESDGTDARRNPSWSADGQNVVYIANPGSDARVVSKRVLDSSMALRSSLTTTLDLAASNASTAQLSPDARWVYYLRNNNVHRAVNREGGRVVNITRHLDTDISDYVVSP